jgi:hypothetical protein
LDTVQELKNQVKQRNLLLENAKANVKKRFIPTLERQLASLRQTPSQASNSRSPTDWYFLGASHFNGSESHAVDDVEIVDQSDNEDNTETDFQIQRSATEHGLMFDGEESEDVADDEDFE